MTVARRVRSSSFVLLAVALPAAPQIVAPSTQSPQQLPNAQDQILQQFFQVPDPMQSTWARQPPTRRPVFSGFPTFPSRLSGYGSYPVDPSGAANGTTMPGTVPPSLLLPNPFANGVVPPMLIGAEPEPRAWPAEAGTALPYEPGVALLVRHVDRVWWRKPDDDVFVPLFFHGKFALARAGAAIEVRQEGSFEIVLHETGRVVAHGPTALTLRTLDAERVELTFTQLTRLRWIVTGRAQTLELPDGSQLRFTKSEATADAPPQLGDLVLERPFDPGWLGGRVSITNLGERDVEWLAAGGARVLRPGERATAFLSKPPHAIGAPLVGKDVALQREGALAIARAAGNAAVEWSGAAFDLGAGQELRLDPIQGDPFTPPPAKTPAEPAKAPPAVGATR